MDILVIGAPDLESALRSFVASYWQLSITTTIGVWHQGQLVARIVPGTDPQGQPMPMLETIRS